MRTLLLVAAMIAAGPSVGLARDGFGLGLALGDPSGLALKKFVGSSAAIQGTIGLGLVGGKHVGGHVDMVWHQPLTTLGGAPLDWYWGLGGKLGVFDGDKKDGVWLGGRAPLGLAVNPTSVPLDVFFEVAAGLWVIEKVAFDLDGAIGVRYWF